jgi:hypothetical protein
VNDLEYTRKKLIKDVVENPLFSPMVQGIREEMAFAMLNTDKEDERDKLYYEAQALNRIVAQLTVFANEIRMVTDE